MPRAIDPYMSECCPIDAYHCGYSSTLSELRIVLVGNIGDNENTVVKSILNLGNATGEKFGLCTLYKREYQRQKISVLVAPGWYKLSKLQTSEKIKEELVRAVSLCPPGPHALLLLIPVKTLNEEPSAGELKSAQMHMELLSEHVWKHTIVLFVCEDGVEDAAIKEHTHSAEKILEKCGGRYCVVKKSSFQIHQDYSLQVFRKIDELVKENRAKVFIPQIYYELIQHKTEETSDETEVRQRRGSLDNPPHLSKDEGDSERKDTVYEAPKHPNAPAISMDFCQFVVMFMCVAGALLGSVAGAQSGVSGSFSGLIVGVILGVLLAGFIVYIYNVIHTHTQSKQPTQKTS